MKIHFERKLNEKSGLHKATFHTIHISVNSYKAYNKQL